MAINFIQPQAEGLLDMNISNIKIDTDAFENVEASIATVVNPAKERGIGEFTLHFEDANGYSLVSFSFSNYEPEWALETGEWYMTDDRDEIGEFIQCALHDSIDKGLVARYVPADSDTARH